MLDPDPSFDTNRNTKGSYRRATDDIGRALKQLRINDMPDVAAFLFYYLACEKLAKIMKGACLGKKKDEIFEARGGTPSASKICSYLQQLNCTFQEENINSIFDKDKKYSARWLRNNIVHEIGPSHAKQIVEHSRNLVQKMKLFLRYRKSVVQYLEKISRKG